jgi:hypothetical protein
MKIPNTLFSRSGALFIIVMMLAMLVAPTLLPIGQADAAQISSRKIELGSSELGSVSTDANGTAVSAGQGGNGAQTYHKFTFTPTTATIGAILFQYCDSPFIGTTCNAPTGINVSAVNAMTAASGYSGTFTFDTTTNAVTTGWFATSNNACASATGRTNCILLSTGTPTAQAASAHVVTFGAGANWITNPTSVGANTGTYYVRIVTFTSNTYGTAVDNGTVAFNLNNDVDITAKVQEQLKFSIGAVQGAQSAPGTTCAPLTGTTSIALGSVGVLDAQTAYDAHSYFRVNANSANGTVVQYTAPTLHTAAGVTITVPGGMATTPAASTVGTEQFGLGFDSADPATNGWSVTNLTTRPSPYNSANGTIVNAGTATFGFSTGSTTTPVTIASSSGIVTCDTLSVRYIANISPTTAPGIYRTNVGYIATPMY